MVRMQLTSSGVELMHQSRHARTLLPNVRYIDLTGARYVALTIGLESIVCTCGITPRAPAPSPHPIVFSTIVPLFLDPPSQNETRRQGSILTVALIIADLLTFVPAAHKASPRATSAAGGPHRPPGSLGTNRKTRGTTQCAQHTVT